MNSDSIMKRLALTLLTWLLCRGLDVSAASPLDQIRADWQSRREQTSSVRYRLNGTFLVTKGTFDGDHLLPPDAKGVALNEDYTCPHTGDWAFDFANNRFRLRTTSAAFHVNSASFHPIGDLAVFDGRQLLIHRFAVSENRGKFYSNIQPDFQICKLRHPVLTASVWPACFAHGYIHPHGGEEWLRDLGAPLEDDALNLHGNGIADGRPCKIVRLTATPHGAFTELWVDLARKSAIVRIRRIDSGVSASVDIRNQQTRDGWFPAEWTYVQYDPGSGKPTRHIQLAVQSLELNETISDEAFSLEPSVGMVIYDEREGIAYILGKNGERLPRSSLDIQHNEWRYSHLMLLTLPVGLFLVCCLYFYRRKSWRVRQRKT